LQAGTHARPSPEEIAKTPGPVTATPPCLEVRDPPVAISASLAASMFVESVLTSSLGLRRPRSFLALRTPTPDRLTRLPPSMTSHYLICFPCCPSYHKQSSLHQVPSDFHFNGGGFSSAGGRKSGIHPAVSHSQILITMAAPPSFTWNLHAFEIQYLESMIFVSSECPDEGRNL
jgi:hypothetical protein